MRIETHCTFINWRVTLLLIIAHYCDQHICLSVCLHARISRKPNGRTFSTMKEAVALYSSNGVAICYVLYFRFCGWLGWTQWPGIIWHSQFTPPVELSRVGRCELDYKATRIGLMCSSDSPCRMGRSLVLLSLDCMPRYIAALCVSIYSWSSLNSAPLSPNIAQ